MRKKFGDWDGFGERTNYTDIHLFDTKLTTWLGSWNGNKEKVYVLIKEDRKWENDEIVSWAEVCWMKLTGKPLEKEK